MLRFRRPTPPSTTTTRLHTQHVRTKKTLLWLIIVGERNHHHVCSVSRPFALLPQQTNTRLRPNYITWPRYSWMNFSARLKMRARFLAFLALEDSSCSFLMIAHCSLRFRFLSRVSGTVLTESSTVSMSAMIDAATTITLGQGFRALKLRSKPKETFSELSRPPKP